MPLYDEEVEEIPEGYVPPEKFARPSAIADETEASAEEDLDALLEAHNRGQLKINYYQAVYQAGVVTDDGSVESQEVNEEARNWVRSQIVRLIRGQTTETPKDQLTPEEVAQVRAMLANPPSQFTAFEVASIKSLASKVQRLEPAPIKTTVEPVTAKATPAPTVGQKPRPVAKPAVKAGAPAPTEKVGANTAKVGGQKKPKTPKGPIGQTEYKVVNVSKSGIEEVVSVKPAPRARLPGALPFPSPSQMEAISFMASQKTTSQGTQAANAHDMSASELARTKKLIG